MFPFAIASRCMGFDIYLQCFAGEPPGISRAAVRALFPIVEQDSEPDSWSVRYDNVNCCKIGIRPSKVDDKLITALSVNRPCGDVRFWESVFAILRLGPMMLYWPGGGPLVGSKLAARALPAEIAESLGQPACVGSAQEIMAAIRAS
jgi:hypothetical protein